MSEHLPKVILIDLTGAIDAILEYSKGMDYNTYLADRKTRDAIYRNMEVMGEAVSRLPDYFLNNHTDIPWSKIQSARNVFIHGYDKIDDRIVWNIVVNILPDLKNKIENILEHLQ